MVTFLTNRIAKWLRVLAIAVPTITVVWFYHWTVYTAGGFNPPGNEDYYNFLVRGWREGHLYMTVEPVPKMLKLADPYDPQQNGPYRLADASFYHGRYYLYFGAVPALMFMLPYAILSGRELGTTTLIFWLSTAGFLCAVTAWLRHRGKYFPQSSIWVGVLGIFVLGFGTHILALLRRPLVWELPIACGYFFSMLGVLLTSEGLRAQWVKRWFIVGICAGLAIGARPVYVFGLVGFVPIAVWAYRTRVGGARPSLECLLWLASGVALCVIGILVHNFARFGNFLEFGQNYQLSGVYESKMKHFSVAYWLYNAKLYFCTLPRWSSLFPFISAPIDRNGPPGHLSSWNEGVIGLVFSFPSVVCYACALLPCHKSEQLRKAASVFSSYIVVFSASMTLAMLSYFLVTPRYMADFSPYLMFGAGLGMLVIECHVRQKRTRHLTMAIVIAAAAITSITGVLISFDYHERLMKKTAPEEWKRLEAVLNK